MQRKNPLIKFLATTCTCKTYVTNIFSYKNALRSAPSLVPLSPSDSVVSAIPTQCTVLKARFSGFLACFPCATCVRTHAGSRTGSRTGKSVVVYLEIGENYYFEGSDRHYQPQLTSVTSVGSWRNGRGRPMVLNFR